VEHESQEGQPTPPAAPRYTTRDFIRGTSLRRALSRALIAGLLLGCIGVFLVYQLRPRRSDTPVQAPEALPQDAQQAASGFVHTQSEGGHPVFTIRAQRSVEFAGGEGTTLEGVEVEIFGRNGDRHDVISTNSCRFEPGSGNFSCAGPVEIELNAPRKPQSAEPRIEHPGGSTVTPGSEPIHLETSGLAYNQQRAMATTAKPVKWRYGPASGSATGLTYATRGEWLELQHDVVVNWPVRGSVGSRTSSLRLSSARLRYVKADQLIDMLGPVQISDGDKHLGAQHATISLDAKNRLTAALLNGGVRASDPSGASLLTAQGESLKAEFDPDSGEVRQLDMGGNVQLESEQGPTSSSTRLRADQVRVSFVGAHFHPDHGLAAGNVQIAAQPAHPAYSVARASTQSQSSLRSEELDASEVQFTFHSADGTLDRANTVGPGKLILVPASAKEGKRTVTAGQFVMAFDQVGRLTNLRGLAPTRILFEPAQNAPPGTVAADSRADNLQARLNPNSQSIEFLQQSGRYQLLYGDRQATADQADYSPDASAVTLTGKPVMRDPDTRMSSDRFVFHQASNTAEGYGHVTSTHFGALAASAPERGSQAKPSHTSDIPLGNPQQSSESGTVKASSDGPDGNPESSSASTNVLADRVNADRTKQSVHYEGHVRAWRGADVVEAPSLDIYRADRRIVATDGVLTSNLAPTPLKAPALRDSGVVGSGAGATVRSKRGSKTTPTADQPVTVRADRLEYLEVGSKAAYRGHVRMDHAGATLEADQLDAYFSKSTARQPSELERAVANGSVIVVEPGRRATGDRAEYFAADGRIELSGGPPTLYDTAKGFTTGRILTFFTGDDTLQVDGGQGSRALSKHRLSQ